MSTKRTRSGGTRPQRRRAGNRKKSGSGLMWWGLGFGAVLVAGVISATSGPAGHHPEPRDGVGPQHVANAATFASYPRIARVYREAAQVPAVLDGIYCYCHCEEHAGHYSLLDCYNNEHAAGCDVCLSEGDMAYQMTQDGKTLDQIRAAIDNLYGS